MSNITWAKTIGNWGARSNDDVRTPVVIEKKAPELTEEESIILINEITQLHSELKRKCEKFYKKRQVKELHDAISTLEMSKRSLEGIRFFISKDEKRTSEDWQKLFPKVLVMDPDGWHRDERYQYEWYEELISIEEYIDKVSHSTCMWSIGSDFETYFHSWLK